MLFKLAWRNIWRNKRRTFITVAAIFFAVFFSVSMNSIQKGAWGRMLDNMVNFYHGYGQVHQKGYWENQSINKSLSMQDDLFTIGKDIPKLNALVPRLESFALASHGTHTSGMLVIGVDPVLENEVTGLSERLVEGSYFSADDKGVIIAEGVKDILKIGMGDSLILISQGYHGVNAAGKYPVVGIVKFASPDLNKKMVYLPLKAAQYFFGAEGMVSSVVLDVDNRKDIESVLAELNTQLDTSAYEMMSWQEILPDLIEAEKTDAAGNYILLLVLYVIISFGIFGTILMMAKEREYEFGILLSIGMKRWILAFTVWLEVVLMGLFGALLGILGSMPLVYYLKLNPINFSEMSEEMSSAYEKFGFDPVFPAVFEFSVFFWQAAIVFVITSILALYAMWKIWWLKPIEAMRR